MQVDTITGQIHIHDRQQLAAAFYEHRQGIFGAFDLFHQQSDTWLSVVVNGPLACLHYFPAGRHPGFQSQAGEVQPTTAADETVHFLQCSGSEADSFDLLLSTTVSLELALAAVQQFFDSPALPTCIQWQEL